MNYSKRTLQYKCIKLFTKSISQNYQFLQLKGIKLIRKNLENISDWKNLLDLVPNFYLENKMKKTGLAGLFTASLELVKRE